MTSRWRVLVVGEDAEVVADGIAAARDELAVTVGTDGNGPPDAGTDGDELQVPADVDAVVWCGDADERFEALVAAVDAPVFALVGADASPAAALDAGATDAVRGGPDAERVLARRLEDELGTGRDELAAGVTDGGARLGGRYRAILEQVDDPVFLKDRDGRYEYVNEPAAALFDRPVDDIVGATDADLFDAETVREIRDDDRRVVETGESVTVEHTRVFGGDERSFETVKHPYERDGEIAGVIGVARDVTEYRETERRLQRNERALRALQRLAARGDRSLTATLDEALTIGCDRLDLPMGFLTRIEGDTETIVASAGDVEGLADGAEVPLAETYCRRTLEADGLLAVEHASEEGWVDDSAYERFGLECYLGGEVVVDGESYGTLCFADAERRDRPFSDAERTFIELLVEWVGHEIERAERERDLEGFETIVRSVEEGIYELDADGRFTFVNPAMAELTGYDPDELLGEHVTSVKDDAETEAALEALLAGDADERTVESRIRPKRGRPITCEDSMTRLADDDGTRGVVGVVRDVTEQRTHVETLSDLVTSSRSLMQARDREEVALLVTRAVASVLGFDLTVVRFFERDTERLVPVGTSDEVDDRLPVPVYDIEEGDPGEAFVSGETVEVPDTAESEDEYNRDVVRSALHLPMGVHGTISIGATERDAFSDLDRQVAELLSTSAAAAANRAKREQEVREARERVDTLVDRINGLIENTVEVLVNAGTREQLEAGVTEQLVATDPYEFAWFGRPDVATETISASAWSGDVPPLADAVADWTVDRDAAREAGDPVARALGDESVQVVDDLAAVPDDSVHARARDAGLGSMIVVPLTYKDASYGALTVYAAERAAFADREQVVLDALGRAVANAINAIESGRILTTDRVVELEFTVQDADLLFGRLSAQVDATFDLDGLVTQSDGSLRMYVTCEADADAVREVLDDDPDVRDFNVIVDHDGELLFEVAVEESLVGTLADHGAVTQAISAADGVVRYTTELPYEAEAREVFELVDDRYESTDLVGYHEHERPVQTRQEFREAVTERFTDRQETAVRTAHLGGFFRWPREIDGDALADSMGISRPTYHQHLRAAQRKVFDELFGTDDE